MTPQRQGPGLILASASPRRAMLLRRAGFVFEIVTPPFDDSTAPPLDLPVVQVPAELAYRKAASAAATLPRGIVLGADTVLAVDGRLVGKPADAGDAKRMLEALFDRPHEVVTGVAVIDAASGRCERLTDTATVTIARPEGRRFEAYLQSGHWAGKAGAYNLDELRGQWRFDVQGDPGTVIGLPMRRLAALLESFDIRADPDCRLNRP